MSQAIRRMPLTEAKALAEELAEQLRPVCHRVEVAGSVRRQKPTIADLDICVVAKFAENPLLPGEPGQSLLNVELERLIDARRLARLEGGAKKKTFTVFSAEGESLCVLELWVATPETWPCVFLIRTGPWDFSKRLVTAKRHNGLCPSHLCFRDGRLCHNGTGRAYDLKEERDVFKALGLPFIQPEERHLWADSKKK